MNGFGGRHERARIWRRDGRYMPHKLACLGGVMLAGKVAVWVLLEDGDDIVWVRRRLCSETLGSFSD